ncbi:MAG: GspE/PulE family protein [Planctomycetota bacterium]
MTATEAIAASQEFVRRVPYDFARRHLVLGVGVGPDRLLVGDRTDPQAVHNVGVRLGVHAPTESVAEDRLARIIDDAFAEHGDRSENGDIDEPTADGRSQDLDALLEAVDRDLLSTDGKGEVVRLVDALIFDALDRGASDLHVQPLADRTLIRMRTDGVLHVARELPHGLTAAVTSRIKVMGRMDIAERRIPQDGRATVTVGDAKGAGRAIDLRISTLPTSYGERVVVRLLDTQRGLALSNLESLGMPDDVRDRYVERASRPNGIILMTGPTGSGKTTTLYTTLRLIAARGGGELNVMTIEDPIEYELSDVGVAISQAQVNTKKGVTFASGLRHILRQDPDVVMVGEIRDAETAKTAIQASLTGHLVFSTLHTNDAASAVTRLVDLGVEPYLVGASLSAVLAQRLVRVLHASCDGEGCEGCLQSGYLGRRAIFELLAVDDQIRELVSAGSPTSAIRRRAVELGARSLREDGMRLVELGATTRAEVERVTVDLEDAAREPRRPADV